MDERRTKHGSRLRWWIQRTALTLGVVACLLPVGCDRNDGIGALTGYKRGGGESDSQDDGSPAIALRDLFSGAQLVDGEPSVGQFMVPESESGSAGPFGGSDGGGASLLTPVVAVFSESIDPATLTEGSFTLSAPSEDPEGAPVPVTASVVLDPATANRVAVLLPGALERNTVYTATLAGSITDLEGNPVTASDDGSGEGNSTSFRTVGNPGLMPFDVIAIYPEPDGNNVPVDSVIQLYFTIPVAVGGPNDIDAPGNLSVTSKTTEIAGTIEVQPDARIVRFTPDNDLPQGAAVTVTVNGSVESEPVSAFGESFTFTLDPTDDYVSTFTVSNVPTPTQIKLVDNAPIMGGPIPYAGSLTSSNLEKFKSYVKVPAGPEADSVTLLFFQDRGGSGSAARAFTQNQGNGNIDFKVDLSEGGQDSAFVDTGSTTPPSPLILGAYTTSGGLRSPVGPVTLPNVFVKTSKPRIELGPPGEDGSRYGFRSVLAEPALYGTASEAIADFKVVVDATTIPSTFEAVRLSGSLAVSDENDFFITSPAESAIPGGGIGPGPQYLAIPISEIKFDDSAGNEVVVKSPKAGSIHLEGSIGGALEQSSTDALEVRVVRADTLEPIKSAEVSITVFPFVDPSPKVKSKTNKNGVAKFQQGELGMLSSTYLMMTVSRSKYDLFTLAGFETPTQANSMGISVLLHKSGQSPTVIEVVTEEDIPPEKSSKAFVGSASGSASPSPDNKQLIEDTRYFTDKLPSGSKGSQTYLDVDPLRPQVLINMEYDGVSSYVFETTPVQVIEKDTQITFNYFEKGTDPDKWFAKSFANTVVNLADVTAAGITEPAKELLRGRLVGRIPGLPGVLPVSFSPQATNSGVPGLRVVFAPIPPSLWQNEITPDVDPEHELLMQPGAATGVLDPSDLLLEQTFRLEVEAAEENSTRLTRHRAQLDFIQPQQEAVTLATDPVDLPKIPVLSPIDNVYPPSLDIDIEVGGIADMLPADSLYRITLTRKGAERSWTALVSAKAITTGPGPVTFSFPTTNKSPFNVPTKFKVMVESIEFENGTFDFDSFVFSDVERLHRRLSRSKTVNINTGPP